MRTLLCFVFASLVIASCAGRQTGVAVRSPAALDAAVNISKTGDAEKTREAIEEACLGEDEAACYLLWQPVPLDRLSRLPIVQGVTNEDSTQITIMHAADEAPTVHLWDPAIPRWMVPRDTQRRSFQGSKYRLTWVRYRGLQKNHDYALQVFSKTGKLLDLRRLKSLDTEKKNVTFALASCMDDKFAETYNYMWTEMLSHKPDLVFFLGDNVYADRNAKGKKVADPNQLWTRYTQTRLALDMFRQEQLVPVFATWDDHDYGMDNGNRTYQHQAESKEIFLRFFPQATVVDFFERGPGLAAHFKAFGQQFFLMDDRYYRSSPQEAAIETHWGFQQEKWFTDTLKKSDAPAWILNGDQFFGLHHPHESFERNHPKAFQRLLAVLRGAAAPVVFVSGDRHLTEIQKIPYQTLGYETYEITSSPMHAKVFPDAYQHDRNPKKVEGVAGVMNYAIVTSQSDGDGVRFEVTALGPKKRVLYSRTFNVRK